MLIEEIVTLTGWELAIDFIVMDMLDFNMIRDMDFLSKYGLEMDYRKKKVQFNLDNENKFSFKEVKCSALWLVVLKLEKY